MSCSVIRAENFWRIFRVHFQSAKLQFVKCERLYLQTYLHEAVCIIRYSCQNAHKNNQWRSISGYFRALNFSLVFSSVFLCCRWISFSSVHCSLKRNIRLPGLHNCCCKLCKFCNNQMVCYTYICYFVFMIGCFFLIKSSLSILRNNLCFRIVTNHNNRRWALTESAVRSILSLLWRFTLVEVNSEVERAKWWFSLGLNWEKN